MFKFEYFFLFIVFKQYFLTLSTFLLTFLKLINILLS